MPYIFFEFAIAVTSNDHIETLTIDRLVAGEMTIFIPFLAHINNSLKKLVRENTDFSVTVEVKDALYKHLNYVQWQFADSICKNGTLESLVVLPFQHDDDDYEDTRSGLAHLLGNLQLNHGLTYL